MLKEALAKPSRVPADFKFGRGDRSFPSSGRSAFISTSLFSGPHLGTVQCRMCHLEFPGEKCSRGRGICIAIRDESCMTGTIFRSKLWNGGRRKGQRKQTGTYQPP